MNLLQISYISCFSAGVPAIAAAIRHRRATREYHPFLLLMIASMITEAINYMLLIRGRSNAVPSNIYSLVELFLLCWFFKRWAVFQSKRHLYVALLVLFSSIWIINNTILAGADKFSSCYAAVVSFAYVLMAINVINRLASAGNKATLNSPVFLVCLGIILYYTCAILIEIFYLYGTGSSADFQGKIYLVMFLINILVNLIYATAILCIQKKPEIRLL